MKRGVDQEIKWLCGKADMATTPDKNQVTENGNAIISVSARFAKAALDTLFPPQCLLSREMVTAPGELAPSVWKTLHFLDAPFCAVCGVPFAVDAGLDAVCPSCLAQPPAYDRARAAFVYDDHSKRLILDFKYRDRHDGANAFAGWMYRAGRELFKSNALVAPVPLHFSRLLRRRFNQSAMLSLKLAELAGVEVVPDLLVRNRRTPQQKGLSWRARRRNVAGAFSLNERYAREFRDRDVVLIDDVFTTGATVEACARVLKRRGAKKVDVLTLARVVSEGQRLI